MITLDLAHALHIENSRHIGRKTDNTTKYGGRGVGGGTALNTKENIYIYVSDKVN
jgi:hypothetical protein